MKVSKTASSRRWLRPIMAFAVMVVTATLLMGTGSSAYAGGSNCNPDTVGSGCTVTPPGGGGTGGGSGGGGKGGGGGSTGVPPVTKTSYYASQSANRGALSPAIPAATYKGSSGTPTSIYNACSTKKNTYDIAGHVITQYASGVVYITGEAYAYQGSVLVGLGVEDEFQYCVYPYAPVEESNTCPYSAGPGTLTGPWGTGLPVVLGDGTVDPRTESKTWTTPLEYSGVGNDYNASGPTLGLSNSAYINAVTGCPNITYVFSVSNSKCTLASGQSVVDSSDCQLVPGNYTTTATSKQITCDYIYYPSYRTYTALTCGSPYKCTVTGCSFDRVDALYCNNTIHSGADYTYNFATCGNSVPQPTCSWSNGTGKASLTDPYGVAQSSGVQVTADGKAWKLSIASLSCTGSLQNKAEKVIVSAGSQPFRAGYSAGASNQPVFGSFSPTATTGSILSLLSESAAGTDGWSNNTIYLRFYQPTTTATVSTPVGAGEVSNPVTAKVGSAIPFGVYNVYTFTVPTTVTVGYGGGTTTINVPFTIAAPQTLFYPISGRVTG